MLAVVKFSLPNITRNLIYHDYILQESLLLMMIVLV